VGETGRSWWVCRAPVRSDPIAWIALGAVLIGFIVGFAVADGVSFLGSIYEALVVAITAAVMTCIVCGSVRGYREGRRGPLAGR
jgi:hypothetical protein